MLIYLPTCLPSLGRSPPGQCLRASPAGLKSWSRLSRSCGREPRVHRQQHDRVARALGSLSRGLVFRIISHIAKQHQTPLLKWPNVEGDPPYDGIYAINVVHIMPRTAILSFFAGCGRNLRPGGVLGLYDTWTFNKEHVGPNNERFDASLRSQGYGGVASIEACDEAAARAGLERASVTYLAANNQFVTYRKLDDGGITPALQAFAEAQARADMLEEDPNPPDLPMGPEPFSDGEDEEVEDDECGVGRPLSPVEDGVRGPQSPLTPRRRRRDPCTGDAPRRHRRDSAADTRPGSISCLYLATARLAGVLRRGYPGNSSQRLGQSKKSRLVLPRYRAGDVILGRGVHDLAFGELVYFFRDGRPGKAENNRELVVHFLRGGAPKRPKFCLLFGRKHEQRRGWFRQWHRVERLQVRGRGVVIIIRLWRVVRKEGRGVRICGVPAAVVSVTLLSLPSTRPQVSSRAFFCIAPRHRVLLVC